MAINILCENLRDKCHTEMPNKRFSSKILWVGHALEQEYRVWTAFIVTAPTPHQSAEERGGDAAQGSVFASLVPGYGVGVS